MRDRPVAAGPKCCARWSEHRFPLVGALGDVLSLALDRIEQTGGLAVVVNGGRAKLGGSAHPLGRSYSRLRRHAAGNEQQGFIRAASAYGVPGAFATMDIEDLGRADADSLPHRAEASLAEPPLKQRRR